MSKKTKKTRVPGERTSRRWLWLVVAVVLAVVGVYAGWYLTRYQFNDTYKQYITEPAAAETAVDYAPLSGENHVKGYDLIAVNETLELYAKPDTGEVAIYDLRNGQTVFSNPPDADNDKKANKTNRAYLKSQFFVGYFNSLMATGTYSSFVDCVDLGNLTAESIQDGVRFTYKLGKEVEIYLVPSLLSDERFQELFTQVDASVAKLMYGQANSFYAQQADGSWAVSENGLKMSIRNKNKISQALIELGMTEEEYFEWEVKAGNEIPVNPGFTIVLEWRLKDDYVECSVPSDLIVERDLMLSTIQLLPYMAAAGTDETGYILVPNGTGSIINFNNGKNKADAYSQYVYELDLVDADYTKQQNTQPVRLSLFAMCRENSSVLATIEQGATLANISADVSGRLNSYNNAYASFTLRGDERLDMFGAGETSEMPIVEDHFYKETLTVRYTMLTEEHKGYSGVANYYRQRLMNEGVLTPKAEGGDIPFYYDVIGGVKETAHAVGVQYLRVNPMTTFEQAAEMAKQLQALGIDNQVMNFQGWMNGGYYHDVANKVKVLRQLGGKDGLNELAEAMKALSTDGKKAELFADVAFQNVTYISKRYNVNAETSRYYGAGYVVQFGQVNPANLRRTASLGYAENLYNLLSPKFLPYYVERFIKATEDLNSDLGVSLRDLGNELHADKRRTNVINREEALMVTESQLDALQATGRSLMIAGGNDYALEGVSHVINAPTDATEYFIVDAGVPLYQMIVHGCVDYAGSPMNIQVSDNWDRDLLEMIEYGVAPHYIFTWEEATEMKYTGLSKYYTTTFDAWAEEAAANYQKINEALSPVSGALMTEHASLSDTLKRVTYSNGVVIYVNYGSEAAEADGYTVPAMSWLSMGGEQ